MSNPSRSADEAPPAERATDSAVVSGSSSVDLSAAPAVPPSPEGDGLLAEAEEMTIEPDEYDDIWQTGVRARAELLKGLEELDELDARQEPTLDTGSFQAIESSAEGEPQDWQARADEERARSIDPKRPTDRIEMDEDWKVGEVRDTAEDWPLSVPSPFETGDQNDLERSTDPARRAPTEVIRPNDPLSRFRRAVAKLLREVARRIEP